MKAEAPPRLLLIGWDGADWRLLKPLMDKGLMPALSQLVAEGFSGKLASCEPMISPMLWTSIATGVRAYQHGIHGFIEARPEGDGVRPIRGSQRNVPAVWNILNAHQKHTHVVGWWPSYPAEQVQGVMVSNFYAMPEHQTQEGWPLMPEAAHPLDLQEILAQLQVHPTELTDQILRPFFPDAGILEPQDEVLQSVAKILAHTVSVHNAITYAMEERPWDFAAVYYNGFDHFLHLANRFHPPQLDAVSDTDFKKYHYIVTAACRFFDMMLERLLQLAGPETHVLLVSDHGFDTDQQRKPFLPLTPGAPALEHQPYGIVAGRGPNWQNLSQLHGASLLDVTPTILALFGLPIGTYMEGRVWEEIFKQTQPSQSIPTYKYVPAYAHPGAQPSQNDADALLHQLENLGYIEPIKNEGTAAMEAALRENQFYLAAAYLDGRKYPESIAVLREILQQAPLVPRYCFLMLHATLQAGDVEQFLTTLQRLEGTSLAEDPRMLYYKSLWHLNQRAFHQAFDGFAQLLSKHADRPVLLYQAGHALLEAGAPAEAKEYLEKAAALRPGHAPTWLDLGAVYLQNGQLEEALGAYFEAIEINFAWPQAHHKAAQILVMLEEFAAARTALEVARRFDPQNLEILLLLKSVYHQLQLSNEAQEVALRIENLQNPVVVVSGLPRSGTSMCMQMLVAGGLPVFSDAIRPQDAHNQFGYWEHEAVKRMHVDARFLEQARGKAVKIVAPLVEKIPSNHCYKVIYMQRPTAEVIVSQEKMRGLKPSAIATAFPFAMAMKLDAANQNALKALEKNPQVQVMQLQYHEVLESPEQAAKKIAAFLGASLNLEAMAAAVKKNSYRSRLTDPKN